MPQIQLFVKSPNDQTIVLQIPEDATIKFLKIMISSRFSVLNIPDINWNYHYLIYQGKVINDNQTLSDLGVKDHSNIWIRTRVTKNAFHLHADSHKNNLQSAAQCAQNKNYFRENVLPEICNQ